ncbi:MAG: LLM class flavin-dependent oxidoreductase [Rhodospirillales bacterium]
MHGDGVWLDHTERYAATDEYLTVWRALLAGETVNFSGRHVRCEPGGCCFRLCNGRIPPLYFGGSSGEGQKVAARHADVYLTWGEPPADVGEKIAAARALAATEGATFQFRHSAACHRARNSRRGLACAEKLISHVDDAAIAVAQKAFREIRLGRAAPHGAIARRSPRQNWRSAPICGPASAWCAAARHRAGR